MSINTFESNFEDNQNYQDRDNDYEKRSQLYLQYYYSQSSVIFQICQSCFWCASSFIRLRAFNKCPLCKEENTIDSMPIASDDAYSYDYKEKDRSYSFVQ